MAIVNGYCTLAEIEAWTNVDQGTPTANDESQLELAVMAASRAIDRHCGRYFWNQTATTRILTPKNAYSLMTPDLVSVTTLKTDEDGDGVYEVTWAASDYVLAPVNNAVAYPVRPYWEIQVAYNGRYVFLNLPQSVQIVGVWGWAAVPAAVKQATLIQAARYFRRKDSPYGVAGSANIAAPATMSGQLDVDVQDLLIDYRSAVNWLVNE